MKLNNESGFSLIDTMVSFAVLGVVTAGTVKVMDNFNLQLETTERVSAVSKFGTELLDGGIKLVAEVKNEATEESNLGVCSWAYTKQKNAGMGVIQLILPAEKSKDVLAFSDTRWQKMLPNWKVMPGDHKDCKDSNNYSRCLVPSLSEASEENALALRRSDIVAKLSIVPTYINPAKGFLQPVGLLRSQRKAESASDLAMLVKAELYFTQFRGKTEDNLGQRGVKTYESIFWVPGVGTCDSQNNLRMSLSGMGASDPDGKTIYHRTSFGEAKNVTPVEVTFLRTQAQGGQISQGRFISTNRTSSIVASCNESRYQCPNLNSQTRDYDKVEIKMRLDFKPQNRVAFHATQMDLVPKMKIVKGGEDAVSSTGSLATYYFDGQNTPKEKYTISRSHSMHAHIADGNGKGNRMCRRVCQENTNYNAGGRSTYDTYVPVLDQIYLGYTGLISERLDEALGCTACYMKNCAQLGIGTFGPMQKQPYQPLDSNVPECWVNEDEEEEVYTSEPFQIQGKLNGEGCLAARLIEGDRLLLTARSCSESLPVMCYNFGSFLLAQDVGENNKKIVTDTFQGAHRACFELGKEIVSPEELRRLQDLGLRETKSMSKANRSIINVAYQGLFLAPQIAEDIEAYRIWASKQAVRSNTWFWLNLRYKDGEIVAPPPQIVSDRDPVEAAVTYDANGNLATYISSSGLWSFNPVASDDADYLLFHSLRLKGALPASTTKNTAYKVLCMNGGEPIVSLQKIGNPSQAESVCEQIGSSFVPPRTPVQWVKALEKVKPWSDRFPFPEVAGSKDFDLSEPVWVANYKNAFTDASDEKE